MAYIVIAYVVMAFIVMASSETKVHVVLCARLSRRLVAFPLGSGTPVALHRLYLGIADGMSIARV